MTALLQTMQARLEAAENRANDPVAVVGIGCRFPGGANSARDFWTLLDAGTDAVSLVPPARWDADALYDPDPAMPGKTNTRWGGFIDDVDLFDAGFFGIAPREAVSMDPQQRLVLETAWHAFEHAAIPVQGLAGTRTGVFLGVCTNDYARIGDASGARGALDTYSGTGGSAGVTAGRLSYALGLNGPSLVVDTACSSSLVATHLAVQSLRKGETDLAVAGGVNLVLIPDGTITLSKLHMMAPDGRCRAFDAGASGFVRGEGCGLVVLQRLSEARAQNRRVLAVISGTATNQDGRSSGLTAPSGTAQEKVVREALTDAGMTPGDIAYVEAHGTGTSLGDPIELDALQGVFGPHRPEPLIVGSVKTNIGHLEAAAGIAGLIKAIGVVATGSAPRNLHFHGLNPNVTDGAPALRIAAKPTSLDVTTPLAAGVSSFGFSGTNAHVVVRAPEMQAVDIPDATAPQIIVLSGKTPAAVKTLSAGIQKVTDASLADMAYTLATGRSHFDYRTAVVVTDRGLLAAALAKAGVQKAERVSIAVIVGADVDLPGDLLGELTQSGLVPDAVVAAPGPVRAAFADMAATVIDPGPTVADDLSRIGVTHLVRVGPAGPTTGLDGFECLDYGAGDPIGDRSMADIVARLYAAGADIDWAARYRDSPRRIVDLPFYPFERERYWRDSSGATAGAVHPLVGQPLTLSGGRTVYHTRLTDPSGTYLAGHMINGGIVAPAAALVEAMALVSARQGHGTAVENIVFERPLRLDTPRDIQIEVVGPDVVIVSRSADGDDETRHATARFSDRRPDTMRDGVSALSGNAEPVDADALYHWLDAGGLGFSDGFRRLSDAQRSGNTARARIAAGDAKGHLIWPPVLDAALQTLAVVTFGRSGTMRRPASCKTVWLSGENATGDLTATVTITESGADMAANIRVVDDTGKDIAILHGLTLTRAGDTAAESCWQSLLYRRDWAGRAAPETPAIMADAMSDRLGALVRDRGLGRLVPLGPRLDELAARYAARALAQIGADDVSPPQRQLHRLLQRWPALADADIATELNRLKSDFPDNAGEIALLQRCGDALTDVLRGTVDPLSLIFAPEDEAGIYADPPVSRLLNDAMADAALRLIPEDGPIRVLEVGAGTGSTTAAVLEALPTDRMARYAFTDIAPGLVAQARDRFGAHPWFDAQVLDLDALPSPDDGFDLIIAANVLHATTDLPATLGGLKTLLRPGGSLLALEGVGQQGWIDLVFGMTPGWWAFADDAARADHPMPDRTGWRAVFKAAGLEAGLTQGPPLLHRQSLILARAAPCTRWHVTGEDSPLTGAVAEALSADAGSARQTPPGRVIVAGSDSAGPNMVTDTARLLDDIRRQVLSCPPQVRRLALVTNGAFSGNPAAAAIWGLGRAIAAEMRNLRVISVDVDPGLAPDKAAALLAAELLQNRDEDQIRLGRAGCHVARLVPEDVSAAPAPRIAPDGLHVVTGGFGGLGLASAKWLADQGARRVLLMGRSEPSPQAHAVISELRDKGADIRTEIVDVSDARAVDAVFARHPEPVAGVLHCAGMLDDRPLADLDTEAFRALLGPKAGGALALERHAEGADYFVLYASAIGLVGATGQANHIAANAMLDAIAEARRRAGKPATSLAFAAWRDIGAAASAGLADRMAATGLGTIATDDGLAVLDHTLRGAAPANLAVLPLDRAALTRHAGADVPPIFRAVAQPGFDSPDRDMSGPPPDLPKSGAKADVAATVLREAAEVLAAPGPWAIDAGQSLFAQGFDSLMAVELRNRLQRLFHRDLSATLLFDYPAPANLAAYLDDTLDDTAPPEAAKPTIARGQDTRIAIVGMGCRFPGGADDPQRFWDLLRQGYDAVAPWPDNRPHTGQSQHPPGPAAYIHDAGAFDAGFFRISPREAVSMDPQQRLLLEVAWHALEDAGIAADRLSGSATGVYVGLCNNDYAQVASDCGGIDAWSGTGGAPSVAAGRLAFALGLEGPAMVVDTACSSSMVALHIASRALADGECDIALAGAANLILSPSTTQALDALQMLAPDGRCKAFDASADGFGRGEGVGMLVLKRLDDAQAAGDRILATICASTINQDGRSSSLTAPNGPAQARLIRQTLGRAGLTPADIDYVEAHGTGTPLGDPIEINALREVFGAGRSGAPLVVGAVKASVAHLEAAAGVAGVIKTILALNAAEIPPNAHFTELNPHIDTGSVIALPKAPMAWPARPGMPRRAGVSSFGFSGTNVHVILEQAVDTAPTPIARSGPQLIVVSGASATAATAVAASLVDRLRAAPDTFSTIAANLIQRRSQLGWRIAIVADDPETAAAMLEQAVPVEADPTRAEVILTLDGADPAVIGQSFVEGATLRLPSDHAVPWLSLPLYPFERRHYWFEAPKRNIQGRSAGLLGALQKGPGTAKRFLSTVSANAPDWLGDHVVDGRAVLPAAAMISNFLDAIGGSSCTLSRLGFDTLLDVTEATALFTEISGSDCALHAAPDTGGDWLRIAAAALSTAPPDMDGPGFAGTTDRDVDVSAFYGGFAAQGLTYGRAFQAITRLAAGRGVARARLCLPDGLSADDHILHPVLLDAAFQSLGAAADGLTVTGSAYRPAELARLSVYGRAGRELEVECRLDTAEDGALLADLLLSRPGGGRVARIDGLRLVPTAQATQARARVLTLAWRPVPSHAPMAVSPAIYEIAPGQAPATVVEHLLTHVQASLARDTVEHLVVMTTGAERLGGATHVIDDGGAAARGFLASLALEHPELAPVAIDIAPGASVDPGLIPQKAGMYAVRDGRILRRETEAATQMVTATGMLDRPASGRLGDLSFKPAPDLRPGPNDVVIDVAAAGLNFRDVLNVLRLYPGDAGALGGECAGWVAAIGEAVTGFEIGQPVMAIAPGCHATRVVARAALTWPVPESWTLEQAATLPTVYLSAAEILPEIARRPAARILIHAATGGVGMAALHLAHQSGAEIYATAGSDEKRRLLAGQPGIVWVGDSRKPGFASQIKAVTGGKGVDIVLNSLSDPMIAEGFEALAPNGTFLELGKADIWSAEDAAACRSDVTYRAIALDAEIVAQPDEVGQRWRDLCAQVKPLPVRAFPFAQAPEAYRFMQAARHIGRIALTRQPCDPAGAYIVTGGTGALGQAIALHLAQCGARRLVLVSRGRRTLDPRWLAQVARTGAQVDEVHLDLSRPGAATVLLDGIDGPVGGLIHAAGELSDGVVTGLTARQIKDGFGAKYDAVVQLDLAMRDWPQAAFILFSSAAAVFGSPGQAAYGAANAAQDAVIRNRRRCGFPGAVLNWGAWAAGMAADRPGEAMPVDVALAAFDAVLQGAETAEQILILPDRDMPDADAPGVIHTALRQRLQNAPQAERRALLRQEITTIVAEDMRMDAAALSIRRPLSDYGLDSLLAVQLRNALAAVSGRTMPASLLYDHPNIAALADYLADRLAPDDRPVNDGPDDAAGQGDAPPGAPEPGEPDAADFLLEELERAGY